MEREAVTKKHTTTSQATNIAQLSNAWRTIVTHFSTRYNKTGEITQQHHKTKTLVAFDHMRLSMSELEWAYEVQKVYEILLSNDPDES